mmetsp:Transcript_120391/g.225042  ORF Transcript_120391/g.225042 Transcript_120391/m.225042 type:complete len:204 (+) Transcript_120391:989-1600(+)
MDCKSAWGTLRRILLNLLWVFRSRLRRSAALSPSCSSCRAAAVSPSSQEEAGVWPIITSSEEAAFTSAASAALSLPDKMFGDRSGERLRTRRSFSESMLPKMHTDEATSTILLKGMVQKHCSSLAFVEDVLLLPTLGASDGDLRTSLRACSVSVRVHGSHSVNELTAPAALWTFGTSLSASPKSSLSQLSFMARDRCSAGMAK